jgi:hypothetical protein
MEKNNKELQKLIKVVDIVNSVKEQRMKRWEHLNRMEDVHVKLITNITDWNPIGLRAKGQPKSRWRGEVTNDLKKLEM